MCTNPTFLPKKGCLQTSCEQAKKKGEKEIPILTIACSQSFDKSISLIQINIIFWKIMSLTGCLSTCCIIEIEISYWLEIFVVLVKQQEYERKIFMSVCVWLIFSLVVKADSYNDKMKKFNTANNCDIFPTCLSVC